jgi:retron-type reverse transcriptase
MPLFERKMIFDLYSNRVGKGTHAAIRRAQEYCGQFDYVLKCDVRKFFPSMDHAVLKGIIRKTIACRETLWLLDRLIDGSNRQEPVWQVFPGDDLATAAERRVGLPIGNLTSQWFGGVYLTEFDQWVKETLRCPGYVRYVDDFLLFGDDRGQLADWRGAISRRLTGCV